jgi:molybdenum cofactor cytidylyltransferase
LTAGIVGILLAAGKGSRFGGDKLHYRLPNGLAIGVAAAANLLPACQRLIAVIRPNDNELAELLTHVGCEILTCAAASQGMGHSLAAAVNASANAHAWIVALGDMPFIQTSTHQLVAYHLTQGASLVAPEYQTHRGHPVGFSKNWRSQLIALTGDQGGRFILDRYPSQITHCSVDDPGVLQDIDRRTDLPT